MLHRGDLHGVLADAVRAHEARRGQARPALRRHQHRRTTTPRCASRTARRVRAAYVIGADGIHSKVRAGLFGADRPEFTGCVAWRGLVPMDKLPPQLCADAGHQLARAARPRAALSGAARRDHELHQLRRARRLADRILGDAGHQGRARQRLPRLARRRARDHPPDRDALQMGDDGARPDGALEQGPRHAAWATPAIRPCRSSARAA